MKPTRLAVTLAALAVAAPSLASLLPGEGGTVPGYPGVVGELVQIAGHDAPDTPDALDRATFLRLRPREGGATADAVVLGQPGFSSTPGMWLQTASQIVQRASDRECGVGESVHPCVIEFWIVDRRGSHIEDTRGVLAGWKNDDPKRAVSYYYGPEAFTERGLLKLPPNGNYDTLLGASRAVFEPLTQGDLNFAWDWGFETAAADLEALMALFESDAGTSNVFLAGHSQGGGFVANFAGRRTQSGARGDELLAGLVFLDGGPALGRGDTLTPEALASHAETVGALRSGTEPVVGATLQGITLGTGLGVRSALQGLYYVLEPDEESVMAPASLPHPAALCFVLGYHLPEEQCGGVGLRLTNRAHAGFSFDDDPIPGTFLQAPILTMLGVRSGRLDFQSKAGTEGTCAADGPQGAQPPCPPSQDQIDPNRVYGWLDGGGQGEAGEDGPLNGWVFMNGQFLDRMVRGGANPTSVTSYIQQAGYTPRRTNVEPIRVELAESGRVTLDARALNGITWYQSRRYDIDSQFLGSFARISIDQNGVRHDIDKTLVASPVYVASQGPRANPFPKVTDYTSISAAGTSQSEAAKARSAIDPEIDAALYGHTDFMAADDSVGTGRPGEPGTNVVTHTLLDWILARAKGTVRVPTADELGVVDW
ncbi:MAG: hypothetical protein AAGK22_21190 [Acidobacteriota bacterium]